ncbi:MAG: DUF84 family protein [Bacteroidetes bacterium]|nr:DUF84 family protein [Bacteroidota bacterium]
MRIGVTSENKLKVDAVRKAYSSLNLPIEVIGYSAESGVGEQPLNEQTLEGARNRILDVRSRVPYLDRIISIENGIFREGKKWLDKAVIVIYDLSTNNEYLAYSDSIVFPDKYVERARKSGFQTTTVCHVMLEAGYIANLQDPHFTISGTSRQVYLEKTVLELVERIEQ